jgi:hypothetical protein
MKILRDEAYIAKQKKRSQRASLIGFVFLLGGFVLVFINIQNLLLFQLLALLAGFSLSQYGIYLAHRFNRSPRPDEVLDEAIKKSARGDRMYQYVLPAPHVLLTKAGPIVFVLKYQIGNIVADGNKWRQTGIGFRRYFGQEGLGNPSKEAEKAIAALAGYIKVSLPDLLEVPVGAIIVFTSKNIKNLDVDDADFPAMHYSKVKGFLRQKNSSSKPLPQEQYDALQASFDEAAGELLSE